MWEPRHICKLCVCRYSLALKRIGWVLACELAWQHDRLSFSRLSVAFRASSTSCIRKDLLIFNQARWGQRATSGLGSGLAATIGDEETARTPAGQRFHKSPSPISEAPHKDDTNPMVHAQERLHGHASVPKAFVFSPHTSLYR